MWTLFTVTFLVALAALLAVFSYSLFALFILGLSFYWLILNRRRSALAFLWPIALLATLGVVIGLDYLPRPDGVRNCVSIPSLADAYSTRLTAAPEDTAVDFAANVDRQAFDLKRRAAHVARNAASLSNKAREVLDALVKKGSSADAQRLAEATDLLNQQIQAEVSAAGSPDGLNERFKALDQYLEEQRASVRTLKSQEEREALQRRLEMFQTDSSRTLGTLHTRMLAVETALRNSVDSSLVRSSTDYSVRFDQIANEVSYDERITLSGDVVGLLRVDVTNLQFAGAWSGLRQEISYSLDGVAVEPFPANGILDVRQNASSITVFNRIIEPARIQDACTGSRQARFQELSLRWPTLFPAEVLIEADFSKVDGPARVPLQVELDRAKPIREIRIPQFSYFLAEYPVELQNGSEGQSLIPAGSDLTPQAMRVSSPLRILLLPDSRLFRNDTVQSRRQYFFATNIAATFAILLVGAAIAWLLPQVGQKKP